MQYFVNNEKLKEFYLLAVYLAKNVQSCGVLCLSDSASQPPYNISLKDAKGTSIKALITRLIEYSDRYNKIAIAGLISHFEKKFIPSLILYRGIVFTGLSCTIK